MRGLTRNPTKIKTIKKIQNKYFNTSNYEIIVYPKKGTVE